MRDIVEQLRIEISEDRLGHPIEVMKQAADEIERLRREIRSLRADNLRTYGDTSQKLDKVIERLKNAGI